jgi:hypothetical protein
MTGELPLRYGSLAEQYGGAPMAAIDDLKFAAVLSWHEVVLKRSDPIRPGYSSNYGKRKKAAYV